MSEVEGVREESTEPDQEEMGELSVVEVGLNDDERLRDVMTMLNKMREWEEELGFEGYVEEREYLMFVAKIIVMLSSQDNGLVLAVEVEGECVGCAVVEVNKVERVYKESVVATIKAMYVEEEWRGKGVGKFLLSEVEKRVREAGIKVVVAPVFSVNTIPQMGLSKLGYDKEFVHMMRNVDKEVVGEKDE